MNLIDIPREQIYQNRLSIDDFDVDREGSIEREFLERIYCELDIIQLDGAIKYVIEIFNTAHYITILILGEKRPMLFLSEYLKIASKIGAAPGAEQNTFGRSFLSITMAMVITYLRICDDKYRNPNNQFICAIQKWYVGHFKDEDWDVNTRFLFFNNIIKDDETINKARQFMSRDNFQPILSLKDFERRVLDPVKENGELAQNDLKMEVERLKKENTSLHGEIEQMKKDLYISQEQFDEIFLPNEASHIDEQTKPKSATDNNPQQLNSDTPKYIESLNRQLSEEKDKNAQLEAEINQLKEFLELNKKLESDTKRLQIDERIILISTALGTPWNSDMTNQTQLAKIIEHFSGDNWKSIRSRIVAINSELKQELATPGEGLSQGTKEAISNVIDWLAKATRGERNTQTTDTLIKEIKDVFLNTKE